MRTGERIWCLFSGIRDLPRIEIQTIFTNPILWEFLWCLFDHRVQWKLTITFYQKIVCSHHQTFCLFLVYEWRTRKKFAWVKGFQTLFRVCYVKHHVFSPFFFCVDALLQELNRLKVEPCLRKMKGSFSFTFIFFRK